MLNENVNNQTKEVFDTIPIPRNIKKLKGRVDKLKKEKKLSLEREAKKEGISYENLIKNKEDAAAYTVASMTPLVGDAIAIKELPNDIQEIKNLFEQGFREGDFKKLGLGTLYTAAVTAGILPFAGVVGRAGKKVIKSSLDKAKPLYDKQIEMMSGFPPSGPDALATANNVPVKSIDETDKLLDKAKVDVPINTEIPSLKAQDLANKPIINPSMIGAETELGQKQIALYEKLIKDSKVLDGKPPSPQRLFERTGVYKGSDGKYRFDLDDRDAGFSTSFLDRALVKNPNMQNPPTMLSSGIVSYRHLKPKLFTLREVLDFDSLYKQYGKTLKVGDKAYSNIGNVKVKFISGKSGTRGSYDGETDTITINISDSDGQKITNLGKLESTLLHEVQHAIQRREGFLRGGNSDTMLNKINPRHSQELKNTTEELSNKIDLMKDNVQVGFDKVQPFKHNDVTYNSEEATDYAVKQMAQIAYAKVLGKEYAEVTKKLQDDLGEFLTNSTFPKGIQDKIKKSGDNFFFDIQTKKADLDAQKEKSFGDYEDLYGEREARLVQKRYEKRKAFKAMSGGLDFGDDKITTALRKDTSFIDDMSNNKSQGGLQLNKGGTTMNMNKQMEMFDEGGLKEEGGTIDPVSGNDVPIGSTQEEVRDDIPAQLSEGEFVFPADVVRFIGLEKLMMMRQEAKAGLKRMEEMGQMGNSEEATMPDDMPFDINDLDMEDEREYNRDSQEMNQGGMVRVGGKEMPKPRIQGQQFADGGVVPAQSGTFAAPGSGVTTVPSQFAGQNLPSYNANQTLQTGVRPAYTVPTIPAVTTGYDPKFMTGQEMQTNQTAPSFETLIGKNPGQYDEMRTYKNDAGATLQIPFKNGQPIYPIPEGYTFVDPEEEQTETSTVQSVRPTTTQAQVDGDNDSGTRVGTTMIGKTGKGITDKSLSTNQKTGMVMSALDKATTKGSLGVALNTLGTLGVPGAAALGGFDAINPDRTSLDDVLGQYGYNPATANAVLNDPMAAIGLNQQQAANMANSMSPTELSSPAVQEALAQAMYGMSKAQATSMLGVAPNTTLGIKGYKNGQVDPTTMGTYAFGQSTDDDGNVSYGSVDDFGISMSAMGATGFMGSLADVDRVVNSPTATQKQKNAAIKYKNMVLGKAKQKEQDKKDKVASTRGGKGSLGKSTDQFGGKSLGSGYGIGESTGPGSQTMGTEDVDPTSGGTATGTSQGTSATGMSTDDGGLGGAGDESSSDGSSSDPGGATEGIGDYNTGGLLKKKKPKVKKMKRGGLASR